MTRTTWLAAIFGGLAALAATQSCASPDAQTSEVGQEADGCGAWRYRGAANVDCRYRGTLSGAITAVSGTCANDSQITCTFSGTCEWYVTQRITDCVDDALDCMTELPPEGSIFDPPAERTFALMVGSPLCDPPAPDATLLDFCADKVSTMYTPFREYCEAQFDRNEGGTTCCLSCPTPTPLPGLAATDAGSGSDTTSVCSAEDN